MAQVAVAVLGAMVPGLTMAAKGLSAIGILSIGPARAGRANPRALVAALITGRFIAA
ncbi:hypothetical protein [Jannaschia sp. M317]|uniref:hypothetical protein n=1 Tax=Jannaschia sp. M317 TaxID=2867011 RepID=UPI0021A764CC|nr:hypothetical protein [Jannaschia sp. M317]UWQ18240.1 hypothetical protein K3551_02730 [Jannaschia sp. M317]